MRLSWVFLCTVLVGCTSYQARPLDPVQMAQHFEARSLDAPQLRRYLEKEMGQPVPVWPPTRWDRQMLTLAAGFHSPVLAAARAQVQAAEAGAIAAGARVNPTLDFPFEYALNHHGDGRPYTGGPSLTWTIETGGKRPARIDQAAAQAQAAQFNMADVAWKLHSQVRGALLTMFAESRKAAVLDDRVRYLEQSVAMLERRLQVGAVTLPEVRHAQLLLSQARSEVSTVQEAQASARARLATLIGVPVAALQSVAIDFTEFEHPFLAPEQAQARQAAVLGRADLRVALAEYDAAQAALRQEVAKQYPDIHLGTGYVYDTGASKISFGVGGITLPLFDDHRAAIAQADARRTELAARVEGLQAAILNELDDSLARYSRRRAAFEHVSRQVALAASRQEGATAGFDAGSVDRLELAQARAEFQVFQLDRLNAAVALQAAAGQLEDATQQPLTMAPDSPALDGNVGAQ